MPAPTFNLPTFGAAPNQYATEDGLEGAMNATLLALWNDVVTNAGRAFVGRAEAVAAGQDALPARVGLVFTREGNALVMRGPHMTGDDQLFETAPTWGVIARFNVAPAMLDAGLMPLFNVSGTGDAIIAELTPAIINNGITSIGGLSKLEYIPVASNTAPNPTISIGGTSYGIRNADGGTWPAGGFVIGRSYTLRRRNTMLRVVADATSLDLASARSERITADAQMGSPMLTSVAGTGNAVTASVPSILQDAGIVASNLRAVALIWPADNAAGTVTLNIDGQGAVEVRTADNAVPPAQMLRGGHLVSLVKDGPRWRLASPELRIADLQAESAARAADIAALTTGIADVASRIDEPNETVQTEDVRWIAWDDQGHAMLGWSGSGLRVRLDDWTVGDVAPRVLSDPGIEVVQQTDDTLDGRVLARDAAGNALWMWRAGEGGGFDGMMAQEFWDRGREALNLQAQQLSTTAWQAISVVGQSLSVGGDWAGSGVTRAEFLSRVDPTHALMLTGTFRGDNVQITSLDMPRSQGYNTAIQATGVGPANPSTSVVSAAAPLAYIVNAYRADLGLPLVPIISQCHGISGIRIEDIDPDPNTGTGATTVWENMTYWYQQVVAQAAAQGKTLTVPWHDWVHGTSAAADPPGRYEAALWRYQRDMRALLATIGAEGPALFIMSQPGGNADTSHPNNTWHVCDEMLAFCEAGGGVMATPEYAYQIADNNVHPDAYWTIQFQEVKGRAMAEVEAGRSWTIHRPKPRVTGSQIVLDFDSLRPGEYLVLHDAARYGGEGIDAYAGFEAIGAAITAMQVRGRQVILDCDAVPTGVRYAMQKQNVTGFAGNAWTAHRGLLRTSDIWPSKLLPGVDLYRWVPSFTITF